MKTQKTHYRVIVRNPNSWSPTTGEHEILNDCGHKHRTQEAAEKCMAKLVDFNYRTSASGSWNAAWHNARVEMFVGDEIGQPVESY